jgi:L-malate glycosyltransferase
MNIFQILVTIIRGDAIGNDVLLLDDSFRAAGYCSQILAINIGPGLPKVKQFHETFKPASDDIVIYHMCEGSIISNSLRRMKCRKIAVYHNTTPAHFFARFDQNVARNQAMSIQEIASLRDVFDHCIADSKFNKAELIRMGYDDRKISVIPILLDEEDYKKAPNQKTIAQYSDGWVNVLFVGRIAPNKRQEDIIRAFAWYKKNINSRSRLILVGSPFSDRYLDQLKNYIASIAIEDVLFTGHIPFETILAFYRVADIFLCMSEHEGFCVPLVEAIMFDVPIIAYASTAIPDTLAGCGVLVNEKDPVFIAKTIDRIVLDDTLRQCIIDSQRKRLIEFSNKKVFSELCDAIKS